jgi:hypothetical protein
MLTLMFIIWLSLAGLAVVLMGVAVLMAPSGHRREPVRFRLHVQAMMTWEQGDEGVRGWAWEVLDTRRLEGGQVVVSGLCVSWERALREGLEQRNIAEESWLWKLEDVKR